jgi:hypothetical protein
MTARDNSKSKLEGATFAFSSGEEKVNRNRWQLTRPLTPFKISHLTFSNRNKITFLDLTPPRDLPINRPVFSPNFTNPEASAEAPRGSK